MWQCRKVERALFRWARWRQTIIKQWMDSEVKSLSDLKSEAKAQLQLLNFPESLQLELYWFSAVAADICFNDEASFEKIVIPAGLCLDQRLSWYELRPGTRVCPPEIWSEKDIDFWCRQHGLRKTLMCSTPQDPCILLPSGHELYSVLMKLKGRPKRNLSRRGRGTKYSDRLAVKCACKYPHKTYLEIAREFKLHTKKYNFSTQSNTARHLVARGRKLIKETECAF